VLSHADYLLLEEEVKRDMKDARSDPYRFKQLEKELLALHAIGRNEANRSAAEADYWSRCLDGSRNS
jgi:hypothetical protein